MKFNPKKVSIKSGVPNEINIDGTDIPAIFHKELNILRKVLFSHIMKEFLHYLGCRVLVLFFH